ncbi:MAG: hypothetical protein IKQ50_03980 [Paludibacteraceae bacterium]|nr:hypothetical protein [Paludibacteraceae bacterium]MBR6167572.1 hypothetical protein [Paludibacteraceae bacterium]
MKAFSIQKSVISLALVALVGIAFSSCSMIGGRDKEPSYQLSSLQALWQENNTLHYVRFTTQQSDETNYLYGREWDEAEDVYEEDLLPKGNGWFKYKFESNGSLTEIHLMDNGGAEIPKVYVVTKLTSTDLEYYEKDRASNKFYFSKVVETK